MNYCLERDDKTVQEKELHSENQELNEYNKHQNHCSQVQALNYINMTSLSKMENIIMQLF